VVLTVREDLGCSPGFFFTWRTPMGGAFWPGTKRWRHHQGLDRRRWRKAVFVQAQTKDAHSFLSYQIGKIVESIRFD
jgi:hypothetical protein